MLVDATLLHIEESSIVELTNCRAMRTFHVVGINLKHRLGVHASRLGHAKVLVGFLRSSLLCAVAHQHTTSKSTNRMAVEHILVELMRIAMTNLVVNERVVVYVLRFVGNDTAVAPAFGSITLEGEVEHVARHAIMEGDDIMVDTTVGLLLDINIAHADILVVSFLQAIKVKAGIIGHINLDDLRGAWPQNPHP